MTSCRDRPTEIRYVRNINVPFPEDDNLFIHELIAAFPLLTMCMIVSPTDKAEVCR
jgi:hypothetical protein